MADMTDDQVRALLDEMTREVICGELDKALAERIGRTLLDARAELARVKADAAAAMALVVERAATQSDPWDGPVTKNKIVDAQAIAAQQIKARIRALADPTGVKLLAELRAERDALAADGAGVFWAEKARAFAMQMASVDARAKDAESERDRLAAANAALEAKVAELMNFVGWARDAPSLHQVQQRAHKLLEKKDG